MGRLAALPNLRLKFSGLAMRLFGFGFAERSRPPTSAELERAWRPYFEVCMETFGPSRTMFASNFPVDKGAASYGAVWNAFKRLAADASEDERKALFLATASSTYSLKLTVS
jgi:predicted TIM-barrel fold metal-dependent hydrolase